MHLLKRKAPPKRGQILFFGVFGTAQGVVRGEIGGGPVLALDKTITHPVSLGCDGNHKLSESDPVASGLIKSLSGPGGQVTGVFLEECDEVASSHAKLAVEGQSLPKGSVVRHSKIAPPMRFGVRCGRRRIGKRFFDVDAAAGKSPGRSRSLKLPNEGCHSPCSATTRGRRYRLPNALAVLRLSTRGPPTIGFRPAARATISKPLAR
jgi:hypothetical protein